MFLRHFPFFFRVVVSFPPSLSFSGFTLSLYFSVAISFATFQDPPVFQFDPKRWSFQSVPGPRVFFFPQTFPLCSLFWPFTPMSALFRSFIFSPQLLFSTPSSSRPEVLREYGSFFFQRFVDYPVVSSFFPQCPPPRMLVETFFQDPVTPPLWSFDPPPPPLWSFISFCSAGLYAHHLICPPLLPFLCFAHPPTFSFFFFYLPLLVNSL